MSHNAMFGSMFETTRIDSNGEKLIFASFGSTSRVSVL